MIIFDTEINSRKKSISLQNNFWQEKQPALFSVLTKLHLPFDPSPSSLALLPFYVLWIKIITLFRGKRNIIPLSTKNKWKSVNDREGWWGWLLGFFKVFNTREVYVVNFYSRSSRVRSFCPFAVPRREKND